jgi:DNA-binding beta-propeller fold protein YncE
MAITLLSVGASVVSEARAGEVFSRNKHQLCKPPGQAPNAFVATSTSYTAFSQDGARVAIAGDRRTVHVCETDGGKVIASLAVPTSLDEAAGGRDDVHLVALSPDGTHLVTASRDRKLRLWTIAAGRELAALDHPRPVYFATFSPDGTRLVSSFGDATVRLWNVPEGRETAVLQHPSAVASAVFHPDGGRLVTACVDGTVHIWDMAGGRKIAALQGHTKEVREVRFSPDGARLVTASADTTARIWDAASGKALLILRHPTRVSSAAFSANGTRIVTAAGNDARVFDSATASEIAVLKGHEGDVRDARFSPDGARIVTASDDRSVRIWDTAGGGEIAVLTGHLLAVTSAAFSADGRRIFSSSGPEGIIWTKLAPASLPDGVAGLWFNDLSTPQEPLPPEFAREMCVESPIKVNGDGLIVLFEGFRQPEPPQAVLNMRCASDLTCVIFAEAPGQGLEVQGVGNLALSGKTANLCLAEECRPIARCPAIAWTEAERTSGFAERWEAAVLGSQR